MPLKRSILLALAALLLAGGALWVAHRPAPPPPQATLEDVRREAEAGGYRLITTAELGQRYQQEPAGLLLVDTRQDWEYRAGHIKGAVSFPLEPSAWGRWRAKKPLAALLGPDKNRLVVFY